MWLLIFAILAIILGSDLRRRSAQATEIGRWANTRYLGARYPTANVMGAWMSLAGGIGLNLAVWSFF